MEENKHTKFYCFYCLADGEVVPATTFIYNYFDNLNLPLCPKCFEYQMNHPIKMEFHAN